MKIKHIFLFLIIFALNFTYTFSKVEIFIDPYINNYVLNNISPEQIIDYLNIKDNEMNLSNIELGAKYIWRINPPFDRELPVQIGERWVALSETEKNRAKVMWFNTYINSIDLNDLKKYINIDKIIKRGEEEKHKFHKRQTLTEVDLSSISIPVEKVAAPTPPPPSPAPVRRRPAAVPSRPARTVPAAARRQLPDVRERPTTEATETKPEKKEEPKPEPAKQGFLPPIIQPRQTFPGQPKPEIPSLPIQLPDIQIEQKIDATELERKEIEERQRKVLESIEARERDRAAAREIELAEQLKRRRNLLEDFVRSQQPEAPVPLRPQRTQDDLLREKILELDIQMTRDQIQRKEEQGFRRTITGPPTTLSN